ERNDAEAAGLDSVVTTLVNSEAANGETQITVVFTPGAPLTDGETILVYIGESSAGDPWVDTDATIDSTDVTCAQGGTAFDTYVQTDASGTAPLSFGCSLNGAGDGNPVTVTIGDGAGDDLYNPAGADIYTVSVVTTDDAGAGVVYVGDANDVTVSVTVLANLSMLLDNADGSACTGTPVVTCNLGTVLTTTTVSGNYDINVGTNAANGATVSINDNMTDPNGIGTIQDVTNGQTIDAGTDEYGVSVAEDGDWTFQGNYTTNYTPIADAETALASTAGAIAETSDDITVTHSAAIDSAVVAGTHTHIVTYTVVADF
ncbi:hypothetical protein ACFL0L_05210, partial [Patescibacteria group bacterium]